MSKTLANFKCVEMFSCNLSAKKKKKHFFLPTQIKGKETYFEEI